MKKLFSFVLVIAILFSLCIVSNANDYYTEAYYVKHTSLDTFNGELVSGLEDPHEIEVAPGSETARYTGWVAATEEIVGFAYSVNDSDYVIKASFMHNAEQAVADAAQAVGGTSWSRFIVTVPLTTGENFICVAVVFADEEVEDIWRATVYVEDDGIPDPALGVVEATGHIKTPGIYKLATDITGDKMLLDGEYTIDLCGHTWTGTMTIDGAVVNLIDSVGGGKIESPSTDTLTLVTGELYATGVTVNTQGSGSDAFWLKSGKAVLVDCSATASDNAAVHNDNRQNGNPGNADVTIIGGHFGGKNSLKVQNGSSTVIKGNCVFDTPFYLANGGGKTWEESFVVDAADGTISFAKEGDFATVTYESTADASNISIAGAYFAQPAGEADVEIVSAQATKYTVDLDKYSAGEDKVTISAKFEAKEGFAFADDAVFMINNVAATKTADGAYEAVFEKAKPKEYTVEFDLKGHGAAIDPITVVGGTVIEAPAEPTEEGWIFNGWYSNSTMTQEFDFTKPITADCTAYAKWAKEVVPTEAPATEAPVTAAPTDAPAEEDSGCGSSVMLAQAIILLGAAVLLKRKK